MMEYTYTEPVLKLLFIGRPVDPWPDYVSSYGLTRLDIPELIRLMEDKELRWQFPPEDFSEGDDLTDWYGQIHAWRALAQLKAEEAIPAMIGLLSQVEEFDDDWAGEEIGKALISIGKTSIGPLVAYLHDTRNSTYARIDASEALVGMGKAYPEVLPECISAVVVALEKYPQNDEAVNGFLISALIDFEATEHIDLIRRVFESGNVDIAVAGDFEDVQIELGLLQKRLTPRPPSLLQQALLDFAAKKQRPARAASRRRLTNKEKKKKDQRKQEKKSRKKNRKR